jgi:hypothetical protein
MARLTGLTRDHYGGVLLVACGIGVVVAGLGYHVGSLRQMGSGFFPVVLGTLLALVGVALLATTPLAHGESVAPGAAVPGAEHAHLSGPPVQWRGWLCILGGVGAFAILGAHGGLVPASFACVFIAALGDRRNTWREAALLAVVMTAAGVLVFHVGLRVLLPLFAW